MEEGQEESVIADFDVVLGSPRDLPEVVNCLALKGFCVIDARGSSKLVQDACADAQRLPDQKFLVPPSTEEVRVANGLLGREGSARVLELPLPSPSGEDTGLAELDSLLGELGYGIGIYGPALGVDAGARTAAVVHETVPPGTFLPARELDEEECSKWLGVFTRHRIMLLCFLGPSEGSLELGLFGEEESRRTTRVRTYPGVLVALNAEVVSRQHHVDAGKALVLSIFGCSTSERLREPKEPQLPPYRAELSRWCRERLKLLKDMEAEDDSVLDGLPKQWVRAMNSEYHRGQQACVRGDAARLPGPLGWDSPLFFSQVLGGTDLVIEIPLDRFDIEDWFYQDPEEERWAEYKTYSRHGAFIDGGELYDNKFFGISTPEARSLSPSSTWGMEVGYEAVFRAGWTKKAITRKKADVFYGFHSTENQYFSTFRETSHIGSSGSVAGEPNRISFTLNIMGQSIAFDTDGSSSHAALWHGQLEQTEEDELGRNPIFSLVLGAQWNIVPTVFANFCSRRLLTTKGRSFCFDEDASGFVRGEGCAAICLQKLHELVEEAPLIKSTGLGIVRAVDMMQVGSGATLSAPSGVCMQETMALAAHSAGLRPDDVDVVECHAPGAALQDAVEANVMSKAFREGPEDVALAITDLKTMVGNGYSAAGIFGVVRVLRGTARATLPANNALRRLNPHISAREDKKPLAFLTEPVLHQCLGGTGFSTVNSFGNSGSYVSAVIWGDLREAAAGWALEERPPRRPVVFWPPGGGELDEAARPASGYSIVGSFNQWKAPQAMVEEGPGEWTAVLALGENRWEQFQIWLDGDPEKVLHPGRRRAPRNSPVLGPDGGAADRRGRCGQRYAWQIDGRSVLEPASSFVSSGGAPVQQDVELNFDKGELGTAYKVRLRVAGKYRSVGWERLQDQSAAEAGAVAQPMPGSYFLATSLNNWDLTAMVPGGKGEPGCWTCEFVLKWHVCEFAVLRDEDWDQKCYPAAPGAPPGSCPVLGPDDEGAGLNWIVEGNPGDVFFVEFQRQVDGDSDERSLTCRLVRSLDTPVPEKKYYILGSWSDFTAADVMEPDNEGASWGYTVQLGEGACESFVLLLDGDWHAVYHPSVVDASPYVFHLFRGPVSSAAGRLWTIGKHPDDGAAVGRRYRVKMLLDMGEPCEVRWSSVPDEEAVTSVEGSAGT